MDYRAWLEAEVDRRNSDSMKWRRYAGRDIIPMWVADMDFRAPPEVLSALQQRIEHGVFGYALPTPEFINAVMDAMQRDYGWAVEPSWIVPLAGLVSGLNIACAAVGEPDDVIVTADPVYPPFFTAPVNMHRRLRRVSLREEDDSWDMAALHRDHDPRTRGLLLCHPHNPVGRVWRDDELSSLAAYAEDHDLVVISDEIHCDLILDEGLRHRPIATLSPTVAERTITLMAPSKTYNIPGLGAAFAIIPGQSLRQRFVAAMNGIVPHMNVLGMLATAVAYRDGGPWREELIRYLRENREQVMSLDGLAGIRIRRPQATYLAWLDCRATGMENPQRFFEAAGVGLSDGRDFGEEGFVRLNFGCRRAVLDEALNRMREALRRG